MKLTRRARWLLGIGIAGVLAEAIAFSDFDGAWASDLSLFIQGAPSGASTNTPPANILFVFDSSASMQNLICEDLSGASECDGTLVTAKSVTNGASICTSVGLNAAKGQDLNGDGALDPYKALYA